MKNFLNIFIMYTFLSCTSTFLVYAQMPAKKSHEITLDSAKKYITNLNKDAMQLKTKGGLFYREAFDKILAQKSCVAIRIYYGKMDDGTPTLIAVGVDSSGTDLTSGIICERIYPCPPFCEGTIMLK